MNKKTQKEVSRALTDRNDVVQKLELNEGVDGSVEEWEEEVDDVDGREEDVDDEVAGMEVLVPEDRHDRDLEKQVREPV